MPEKPGLPWSPMSLEASSVSCCHFSHWLRWGLGRRARQASLAGSVAASAAKSSNIFGSSMVERDFSCKVIYVSPTFL